VGSCFLCATGLVPWRAYWNLFGGAVKISLLLTFLFGVGELAASTMQRRLNEANEALKRKEEEERRARELATEARLMSLESRVHPHFLFNAINSILSLIREDPARAEYLLERMAALLRFSLDQSQGRLVPLDRELRVVRDYLEIEKARFGDRLRYKIDTSADLDAEVPPLSIQTLVENSVKYAVSPRREGGTIHVKAFAREGQAVIEVTDDGSGFDDSAVGNGNGLSLVKERLGTLELDRQPGTMTVRTRVPLGVRA
jgi:LytS/YehU family sensor histidine kinase